MALAAKKWINWRTLKWSGEKLHHQWTDLYERYSIKKYCLPKQQSYSFLRCHHLLEDAVLCSCETQMCRFVGLGEATSEVYVLWTVHQDQSESSSREVTWTDSLITQNIPKYCDQYKTLPLHFEQYHECNKHRDNPRKALSSEDKLHMRLTADGFVS